MRQNIGFRATTASEAYSANSERRSHDLEEMATIDFIHLRSFDSELAMRLLQELGRLRQFVKTTPIAWSGLLCLCGGCGINRFHRWQPVQLCGGLTFHSSTNFLPSSIWPFAPPG